MKIKKSIRAPKLKDDNVDPETKSIIDNQLDQLVIKKPANMPLPANGKDRSLKEAFLRRPPNNMIIVQDSVIPGRFPSIVFNYPPFLQIKRRLN